MKIAFYESDLTAEQWAFLELMLPKRKKRGRPPTDCRKVINAIFYIIKGGVQWRLLPAGFPPWKTVYHIFRKWALNHTWEALNARLRAHVREQASKRSRPTAAILDSQSVKSDPHGGEGGYDAGKKIKGRKRHVLVDTLGGFAWLRLILVDGGYTGEAFAQWVQGIRPKREVAVVKRSDDTSDFEVLPRRWVVERTFGWLMRHRRLVRDYETTESSAEAWVYIAMIQMRHRHLALFLGTQGFSDRLLDMTS